MLTPSLVIGKSKITVNYFHLVHIIFLHKYFSVWSSCHDLASKFIRILSRNSKKQSLSPENFILLVQDVVDSHPGLTFLKTAPEFHSRYVHTVMIITHYKYLFIKFN